MSQRLVNAWYARSPWPWLLLPLAFLYALVTRLRRFFYRTGVLRSTKFPVPVVVIGNITAGGTGKTPLTLALIDILQADGWRPGIVSRGYGGKANYPLSVQADTPAAVAGDEPLALQRRSGVPVVVDPLRARAVDFLLQQTDCNIVLCDDGLQHYALGRDIEVVVIDGARGLGNRLPLPAGPLREPPSRLATADFVVINGGDVEWPDAHRMRLEPGAWYGLADKTRTPPLSGARIHAIAGIGNPSRFFSQLALAGYDVVPHPFPDHHVFTAADLAFDDGLPVVMTEKDAVKCEGFAQVNWWVVPVTAQLPPAFHDGLLQRLQAFRR
ncbi:MAG: tetraacyldisaccharide 4'-kinase [Moraxellaceae bacterium]|nr:tetraacyldisaccharide 4'-kinase [Moraxellaceae bacterium]